VAPITSLFVKDAPARRNYLQVQAAADVPNGPRGFAMKCVDFGTWLAATNRVWWKYFVSLANRQSPGLI